MYPFLNGYADMGINVSEPRFREKLVYVIMKVFLICVTFNFCYLLIVIDDCFCLCPVFDKNSS
jgi:hypothetical protein